MVIGAFYRPPNSDSAFVEKVNEFLCSYRNHSSNLVLAGNFNFPSVSSEHDFPKAISTASESFVDLVLLHDLSQLVKQPTRVQNGAESTLDLFLVNRGARKRNPQVQVCEGVSDHKIVILTLETDFAVPNEKKESLIPVFTRASDVDVLDALESSFSYFGSLCQSNECSVDHVWCYFKNVVFRCINAFIPFKRKVQSNSNPWLNKEIVRTSRKLKKARKQFKGTSTTSNADKICTLRFLLKDSIKKAKEHYQLVTLPQFLTSSPAKFWRHFSTKQRAVPNLCLNNVVVTDKQQICEELNDYFCTVFTTDDNVAPSFSPSIVAPPIDDVYIHEEGVLSLLLNLDIKKTPGIDAIPNAFLVRYAEWCSKYLCLMFNKSITCAELPKGWKHAKITPIPKKQNEFLPSSFRPISLLCTCVKMLEHIIFKHIAGYLERNNMLDRRQHGFRKKFSTVTQLL